MRSWRKTVNALLVAIIILATAILGWTSIYYNSQLHATVLEENTNAVSLWLQYADMSLDAVYEHIYELILTVYNNTELRSGSAIMRVSARNKILDTMESKLLANENVDCFFVLDTDADMLLFCANSSLPLWEVQWLKDGVREMTGEHTTGLFSRMWALEERDERVYFVKAITLGKYRVGAICNVANFEITKKFSVLGEKMSFLFVTDGEVLFAGGEIDRSEELKFEENGEPRMPGGLAVVCREMGRADATVILAAETRGFFSYRDVLAFVLLIAASVVLLTLIFVFNWLMRQKIVKPTQELLHATNQISAGDIHYRIREDADSQEFKTLFDSFNNMADQILNLRIESYDRLLTDRENKLRLLRAQIKPHFYLNAVTTISNMTYQGRNDDIREFCVYLARYMRYMLNLRSEWTTVDEEIGHIKTYAQMQSFRFAGDIKLEVDCPAKVGRARIPLLVMFTVVENTFKHAVSIDGQLHIRIIGRKVEELGFSGCCVIIEDDGDGFPESVMELMNTPMEEVLPAKEHLGLSNVRYTMALLFGQQGLLRLSNGEGGGARVEIRIPNAGKGENSA